MSWAGGAAFLGLMGHAAPAGQQRLGPSGGRCILCSNSMWFWGGSPRQALEWGEGGGGGGHRHPPQNIPPNGANSRAP